MQLEDVSDEPHASRTRHFLKTFYGKDATTKSLQLHELQLARDSATEEMLDEIHFMLREILKINKPQ